MINDEDRKLTEVIILLANVVRDAIATNILSDLDEFIAISEETLREEEDE